MATKHRKPRRCSARFVALPHYLLNSPAFRTLPGDAVKLLIHIWKRHNGSNNGEIAFAVREAQEIGIARTPAARALATLVERGFLAVIRNAGFNVGDRKARTWRLTAEPYRGDPGTKDFMRWNPARNGSAAAPKKLFPSPSTGTISPSTGTRAIKLPGLVPPPGLIGQKTGPLKSLHRDTYNIPWEDTSERAPASDSATADEGAEIVTLAAYHGDR